MCPRSCTVLLWHLRVCKCGTHSFIEPCTGPAAVYSPDIDHPQPCASSEQRRADVRTVPVADRLDHAPFLCCTALRMMYVPEEPVCADPKVFVGGLRYEVTREDVEAAFRPLGNLKQVVLLKHRDSGKSKGCAMVLFENWTSAEAAIQQMNGSSDLSAPRPLVVKFADPQPRDDGVLVGVTPKKLFVGQVPMSITREQLGGLFSNYGTVTDVNIMTPKKPGAMACAFVTFATWAEAEAAISALDGNYTFDGASHATTVKFADAKPGELVRAGTKRMADMMMPGASGGGSNKRPFMAMGGGAAGPLAKRGAGGGMGGFNPMNMMGNMGMNPNMGMMNPMMQAMMQNMFMGNMMGMGGAEGFPGGFDGNAMMQNMMAMAQQAGGMGMGGMGGAMGAGMGGAGAAAGGGGGGGGRHVALRPTNASQQQVADAKPWKLFLGQLSYATSEEDLAAFFGQFGSILEVAVLRGNDGRSKGCAFLSYSSQEEAQGALAASGLALPTDPKQRAITVKFAEQH